MKPDWLTVPAAPPVVTTAERVRIIAFYGEAEAKRIEWQRRYLDCDFELLHHRFYSHQCDKHRIDVALSVGRHAVERAKLAQRNLLIVDTFSALEMTSPLAQYDCASGDIYYKLNCGNLALAVLVGMVIASAQLGLIIRVYGQYAEQVFEIAAQLQQ